MDIKRIKASNQNNQLPETRREKRRKKSLLIQFNRYKKIVLNLILIICLILCYIVIIQIGAQTVHKRSAKHNLKKLN